jgi:hypothetical protein
MIIKLVKRCVNFQALQEDFRKAGLAFTTGGVIGIVLQHVVNVKLAIWLAVLGFFIWGCGITEIKKGNQL